MGTFSVRVKWNKKTYEDVVVDTSKDAETFKETLYSLTGVPVDRQKVMCKGIFKGTLKDDMDMDAMPWKDGVLVAMMGTSTGIPKPPEEETRFVEDMTTAEKQKVSAAEPPGLVNLGNTCYMNSTLQCLRAIPELRESLEASPISASSGDISERMTAALRDLFQQMDDSTDEVVPNGFVQAMRLTFPQFAQTTPRGGFAQQDVDEFYNELMQVLSQKLTDGGSVGLGGKSNAVSALFEVEMSTELRCVESEDEEVVRGSDTQRRLQCNITSEIGTLEEGLKLGMESELEKQSRVLGRNALWKQSSRIHKLPRYLVVQFNRFFWKRTPGSMDHEGVNCKILKPVKFSMALDVYDFCDESLQAILSGPRREHAKELMSRGKAKPSTDEMDAEEDEDEDVQAAMRMSMGADGEDAYPGVTVPDDFRGVYELFGVITHKGRASDSGHYMSWVKQNDGPDSWIVFDDEVPSRCTSEDVAKLYGGGDYDMNYVCFYRVPEDQDSI
ncbi:Ubiquitin carboxyl-terminal hydrolase 14 [Hondaea fermentalgiana]|uniref:Ubiquitin carboxyl-terminal hydrolase n=1 Tax=Hondaea fermentalgiana TaxID=2315210 RepID=A0A2R5GPC2_9STRA|nr:Ubiquitin carboxyl-terminal hydrolase 14 [Hondaea fermentalgiana]|eukprot:GBG32465.1 Ubiquitin carboxyl-terminal hydrolase 14 [Hondaea fermentalgiana]